MLPRAHHALMNIIRSSGKMPDLFDPLSKQPRMEINSSQLSCLYMSPNLVLTVSAKPSSLFANFFDEHSGNDSTSHDSVWQGRYLAHICVQGYVYSHKYHVPLYSVQLRSFEFNKSMVSCDCLYLLFSFVITFMLILDVI